MPQGPLEKSRVKKESKPVETLRAKIGRCIIITWSKLSETGAA